MKTRHLLLLLLVLSTLPSFPQKWNPHVVNKQDSFFYYYDCKPDSLIPIPTSDYKDFEDGICAIKLDEFWQFYTEDLKLFLPDSFDYVFDYKKGYYMVAEFRINPTTKRNEYLFGLVSTAGGLMGNNLFSSVGIHSQGFCTATNHLGFNYLLPDTFVMLPKDSFQLALDSLDFSLIPDSVIRYFLSTELEPYQFADTPPTYKEGEKEFNHFLSQNLKYPSFCLNHSIEGTTYVQFVIEADGCTSHYKIIRGVHPLIDMETLRVISQLPNWIPAKNRNKNVRMYYTIPIKFHIHG